jgi:FAD/FMN-containing dehydrogenase
MPPGARFQARPGTGVVRVLLANAEPGEVQAFRERCRRSGGHMVIEHGPAGLRRAVSPWDHHGAAAVDARLRAAFDPNRTLNRGRLLEEPS